MTLDLIDPSGHRLVRSGRYLDDADPQSVWWDASSIGPNVTFEHELEDDADPEGRWQSVHFTCKACRDAGIPAVSGISVAEMVAELDRQWAGDTPRHQRLSTVTEQ